MLATTPASNPNWWVPSSSRAGPVAYGFSDTELNESMGAGPGGGGPGGLGVRRHGHKAVDERGVGDPGRAWGGAPPRPGVPPHPFGVDCVAAAQRVGRARWVTPHPQPAALVHQLRY